MLSETTLNTAMGAESVEQLLAKMTALLQQLLAASNNHAVQQQVAETLARLSKTSKDMALQQGSDGTLESFLNARGITIKTTPAADPTDPVINSLALFLGERYSALSPLLAKIKRSMQNGESITESLKGRSPADISSACQFCTRLYELAFFEQYYYARSPTALIRAKTTTLPKAQQFFSGQWLERFILQKTKSIHGQMAQAVGHPLPFEYLANLQIVLPNGDDFELDLLVSIGSLVYWIEVKSADYQQHISKYSKFARLLGLDSTHSFIVLADAPTERCHDLSSLFTMTVCNLNRFEDALSSVIREDWALLQPNIIKPPL